MKQNKDLIESFSQPFINKFPDIKAFDMLQKINAIFVYMPEPDLCAKACMSTSGQPPYIVKFKAFSEKANRAIDTFVSKNPLFSVLPEPPTNRLVESSTSYSIPNEFTYNQFVDLVEAYCSLLQKQEGIVVKRFKMNIDFTSTGKMQFTALPHNQDFSSLLEKYRGEADLYDNSFMQYAWDLLYQNNLFTETSDDSSNDA